MTVNLRLSLTIFKVGFGVESLSGLAALVTGSTDLPYHGLLLLLSPVFSAFGILFLWIGRHEWTELHRSRVGHANLAFAVSLVATALAAAPIAYLSAEGGPSPPGWLAAEFGIAVALVFAVTFVTYALVASHLVGRFGQVAMALGLGWAVLISGAIGLALAQQLHPIVSTIVTHSPALTPIERPITLLDALLGFSYLGFFAAFADAHWRVAKGLDPAAA
ncbi:MAG: hypothetical protein L3J91_03955 [Thermoplasmata archaeon]|nr:hypothetical protein [Thermoplasmata archaeon]